MEESKQQLIKRAKIYDQLERASDHGIGHPSGPTGWRKPRAPSATGNVARLRRLRKERPELHACVMNGELTVVGATNMAGFYTTKHKPVVERTITALEAMEMWVGPGRSGSTISDDEQRRRLWFEHRDRLMQLFAHGGRRPQAWWRFEAPFAYPGFNLEKSTLWAANLLGAAERRALEADWREEFNQSLAPGFTFRERCGDYLTGRAAHVAHLVFHDCPAALAERFSAELPAAA